MNRPPAPPDPWTETLIDRIELMTSGRTLEILVGEHKDGWLSLRIRTIAPDGRSWTIPIPFTVVDRFSAAIDAARRRIHGIDRDPRRPHRPGAPRGRTTP